MLNCYTLFTSYGLGQSFHSMQYDKIHTVLQLHAKIGGILSLWTPIYFRSLRRMGKFRECWLTDI